MSSTAINDIFQKELHEPGSKEATETKPAIKPLLNHTNGQPPKPEPRKKLSNLTTMTSEIRLTNEIAMEDERSPRLVKIQHSMGEQGQQDNNRENRIPEHTRDRPQISAELTQHDQPKRTSFNDVPVELVADEGVGSPTDVDYDDDDGIADGYYEYDDGSVSSAQVNELANLSRQSMVPLHELIAYYQYIQRGDEKADASPVSRQSSSASQITTRTKYSLQTEESTEKCAGSMDENGERLTKVQTKHLECPKDQLVEVSTTQDIMPRIEIENLDAPNGCQSNDDIDNPCAISKQRELDNKRADRRRVRANVVLELINSERDFVKHLHDVVEGYLYPARRHPEIFTSERINTIFSNIEQLYKFQSKFLESLEACINWEDPAASEVGHCFLEYEKGFSVYHYYCNNHPNATSELQELYTKPRFVKFFEACRLIQNMIDISLDGFLLTPIQKICKYPLQLTELLKNTDDDHSDHSFVVDALESMRNCANLANERKRRIEALADVMLFQEKIENWFGPKLSDTSSILIHSGEVSKMNSHTWSQGVQLYLFDHLLLYFKKDLLKRNILVLKERICMDTVTEISDADEYKPKKSFKLYCSEQQKWFVFTTRSEKEKDEWIQAFERERNLIEADENEGFHITDREIGIARRTLQNRKHSRSARYRHKRPDTAIVDQIDLDDANMIMNRTLSLPSCIHPSHVMNFVEDSRVVSTGKKTSSPSSSSRSPIASSQYLAQEQDGSATQASGNWFKKMGSRKLAKSQVYTVNNQTSTGQNVANTSAKSHTNSPSNRMLTSASFITNETATTNFDQLEKRHRDHMVSEEQARLFRLNNDMSSPPPVPPPLVFARSGTQKSLGPSTTSVPHPSAISQTPSNQGTIIAGPHRSSVNISNLCPVTPSTSVSSDTRIKFGSHSGQVTPSHSGSFGRGLSSGEPSSPVQKPAGQESERQEEKRSTAQSSSFEANIMLSSGRVVHVREDAV